MASGVSLVSFNSRGVEGMHQRSYSVSSADQWTDATVIANSGVSTGKEEQNDDVSDQSKSMKLSDNSLQ